MINLWKRAAAFAEGSDGEPLNCVEHFDSGLITLLYQDYIGGLQVQRWVLIFKKLNLTYLNLT